ncbi:MAG: AMP-binding protein [Beijerinckiaceae bacterium]|jgi:phenylacetate-CoA ligase|nr:AMP-binding protein [Beijerinckiaceae bacterium]
MTAPAFFDAQEIRDPAARLADQLASLRACLAKAITIPGWREHLGPVEPEAIDTLVALASLPVLRKSDLPALQKRQHPFGGLMPGPLGGWKRLMMSPGPIFEPEALEIDPWRAARAMFAAGIRAGQIVQNTFSYHLTPGAWCFDGGARRLGCAVIPAGPGNTEAQLDLIEAYRPGVYAGTPDYLKILLEAADEKRRNTSSLKRAIVSGAAFPPALQAWVADRGIDAYQCYATAECGIIAYQTRAREGMVIDEDVIVELVRPGTGMPVEPGEVGEVVVTVLDPEKPLIRLAVGDLSAFLPGLSPCGRTSQRIKGWMGRADQTAKVRGMFVRPEQVAQLLATLPGSVRARLVIGRENDRDQLTLCLEQAGEGTDLAALASASRAIFKLDTAVERVAPGTLPRDGVVIEDRRPL